MNLKAIFILSLLLGFLPVYSQRCNNDSLHLYPSGDFDYSGEGFVDPNVLPCADYGVYSEIVIPFKVPGGGAKFLTLPDSTTTPIPKIYGVRVDDLNGLPTGLCWTMRPSSSIISGDKVGVLIIKGTSTAASNSYHLDATISIDVHGDGSFAYTSLHPFSYSSILGQPIIRVADSNGNCPTAQ